MGQVACALSSDEAFAGYWQRPDADARQIRDGWYYPGDLGQLDADGDLYLVGRIDDMIISGGENVHPLEIEEWLVRHPAVREAAVVGEPDERLGQRVVAYVVLRRRRSTPDGARRATAWPRRRSPRFKRPREYRFLDELPKSASGKILRRLLRDGHRGRPHDGLRRLPRRARRRDRGVATITLDVPEKINRVSMRARDQLAQVFARARRATTAVRVDRAARRRRAGLHRGRRHRRFMERDAETLSHLHVERGGARALPASP